MHNKAWGLAALCGLPNIHLERYFIKKYQYSAKNLQTPPPIKIIPQPESPNQTKPD